MSRYLVAIHHSDDYDQSVEDETMTCDIDVLNDERVVAGIRVFVGGLQPPVRAEPSRAQPEGKTLVTDGPYLETRGYIGGFWVLEAADLDGALEWGRKAAPVAVTAPSR